MNYTVGRVGKLLGMSRNTIREYAKLGKIDAKKDPINGFWYVSEKGLQQLKDLKKIRG